jgi:hypothetical protein
VCLGTWLDLFVAVSPSRGTTNIQSSLKDYTYTLGTFCFLTALEVGQSYPCYVLSLEMVLALFRVWFSWFRISLRRLESVRAWRNLLHSQCNHLNSHVAFQQSQIASPPTCSLTIAVISLLLAHMQGNCSSEPSAAALRLKNGQLLPHKPGQCVLVTDVRLMAVRQRLWLDRLYIRFKVSTRSPESYSLLVCHDKDCNLWLTSVTLQGDFIDPAPEHGAIEVAGGQLYAEGVLAGQSRYVPECFRLSVCFARWKNR